MEKNEKLQVVELSQFELKNIEGGNPILRAVAGFVIWVIDEWDDISSSYEEGYAAARK